LQQFEIALANVAARCEYEYGFNGASGYQYASVKDNLKWQNLSRKKYTGTIMSIGRYMALKDDDFNKVLLENDTMEQSEIAKVLINAFGDGK